MKSPFEWDDNKNRLNQNKHGVSFYEAQHALHIEAKKFALLGQVIGDRGKKSMKKLKRGNYTNEPIGKIKIVTDFLPSPDELAAKEESVKVTLVLSKASVEYFKEIAEKKHTHYQKMIRILLDKYAAHYQH